MIEAIRNRNTIKFKTEAALHGIQIPDSPQDKLSEENEELSLEDQKKMDAAIQAATQRKMREIASRNKRG